VLRHIANGESNKQIARALDLSVRTVETHRLNIKRKLGIEGQAELIKFAVQHAKGSARFGLACVRKRNPSQHASTYCHSRGNIT
jgi:hypothetical protein